MQPTLVGFVATSVATKENNALQGEYGIKLRFFSSYVYLPVSEIIKCLCGIGIHIAV